MGLSMSSFDVPLQVVLPGEAVLTATEGIATATMRAIKSLPIMLILMADEVLVQ
jgi:hypothetical protein